MERLTKKVKHNTYQLDNVKSLAVKRKLGQLEDIEEELGIDLITLFKALNNDTPIFAKIDDLGIHNIMLNQRCVAIGEVEDSHKREWVLCGWSLLNLLNINKNPNAWLRLKDYGKTWALTKEELEK